MARMFMIVGIVVMVVAIVGLVMPRISIDTQAAPANNLIITAIGLMTFAIARWRSR
jgi:uncharacterized membrane protein